MSDYFRWRKMRAKDVPQADRLLRDMENDYVNACGRFLAREKTSPCYVWTLLGKKGELAALAINSRSTILPVLCGKNDLPEPRFLGAFLRAKKLHSIQGLKNEVAFFENTMERLGRNPSDLIDYDLMSLDNQPSPKTGSPSVPKNLVLRAPKMTDIDAMAPLQAAYEKEEVLPKGSTFSPAASRVNIANIISSGQILVAELDGRLIGKINISAVSFTKYQVGGVYVHPDFRGLGIARRMAAEFIGALIKPGRGVSLFVKKTNFAARRLYLGLGFAVRGDYRISYY